MTETINLMLQFLASLIVLLYDSPFKYFYGLVIILCIVGIIKILMK